MAVVSHVSGVNRADHMRTGKRAVGVYSGMEVKTIALIVIERGGQIALLNIAGKRVTKWVDLARLADSEGECKQHLKWNNFIQYAVSKLRSGYAPKSDVELAWFKRLDSWRASQRNRHKSVGQAPRKCNTERRQRCDWDDAIESMCKQRDYDKSRATRGQWTIWSDTLSANLKRRKVIRGERKAEISEATRISEGIAGVAHQSA